MRTTLTVDEELFHMIREEAARTKRSFREVLNARLRQGFSVSGTKRPKFKVEPFDTGGLVPGVDGEKLNQLFDTLEAERFIGGRGDRE
jgi:hypothetical protein